MGDEIENPDDPVGVQRIGPRISSILRQSTGGTDFEHPYNIGTKCVDLSKEWTVVRRHSDNSSADEYGRAYNCHNAVPDGLCFK